MIHLLFYLPGVEPSCFTVFCELNFCFRNNRISPSSVLPAGLHAHGRATPRREKHISPHNRDVHRVRNSHRSLTQVAPR